MDSKWSTGIGKLFGKVWLFSSLVLSSVALCSSVSVHVRTNTPFTFKAKSDSGPSKDGKLFNFNLALLTSGIDARDKHMQEDIGPNKAASFRMLNDFSDWFEGFLTLNGVEKGVAGTKSGQLYIFKIKLSDFKIQNRSHLGLKIQDEIEVQVMP